jgi:hypothetical protein
LLVISGAALHYAKSTTANAAGEGQMDECIGRLVANPGVERAATNMAACSVERWTSAARAVRRMRKFQIHSAGSLGASGRTRTVFKLGSVCVHELTMTDIRQGAKPARRTCAAASVTGEANGHTRERTRESAAGIAGAILDRSQQI